MDAHGSGSGAPSPDDLLRAYLHDIEQFPRLTFGP